jgi:capsular polysaccharide biosynthesis protein
MLKKNSTINEDFDISLFLYLAKRSLFFVGAFFILSLVSGWLYVRYATKIFEASSVIQLNNSDKYNKILKVDNITQSEEEIASAMELIRSKVFLNNALNKLNLKVSYFAKGTFKLNEHYTSSSYDAEVNVLDKTIFGRPFYIVFKDKRNFAITHPSGTILNGKSGEVLKFKDVELKINVLNEDGIGSMIGLLKDDKYFFVINDPESFANQYASAIDVKLLNANAKTIKVSFNGNNPKKASDIVNVIAEEFLVYDVEKKQESSNKILAYIETQLSNVYNSLKPKINCKTSRRLIN